MNTLPPASKERAAGPIAAQGDDFDRRRMLAAAAGFVVLLAACGYAAALDGLTPLQTVVVRITVAVCVMGLTASIMAFLPIVPLNIGPGTLMLAGGLVAAGTAAYVAVPVNSSRDPAPPGPTVCNVVLPRAAAPREGVVGAHLAPRSFEFILGQPGKTGYLRGRLTVTPGVGCRDGVLGFPVFAGVSREKDYFKLDVIEGDASAATYLEQWRKETRVRFDKGEPLKSSDVLFAGPAPAGATRVIRIEMDFDGGGDKAKATLSWSGNG